MQVFRRIFLSLLLLSVSHLSGEYWCEFPCDSADCPQASCSSLGEFCRKYNAVRFEEDWSFLDCSEYKDCFDDIKYILLDECCDSWIGFGANWRVRGEAWRSFNSQPHADDEFYLNRVVLYADWHPNCWSRFYVQANSAWVSDRELSGKRRLIDMDPITLQNAFAEFTICDSCFDAITLRVGRQEIQLGSHRLVFPRNWANTRRTFDGARLTFCLNNWSVTGWYTRRVRIEKYEWNGASSDQFYGVWADGCLTDYFPLSVYLLGRKQPRASYNGMTENEERYTLGAWSKGEFPFFCDTCLKYDLEAAYQFGDFGPYDISAYMATAYLGYQFKSWCYKPTYWAGFDYATGDDNGDTMKTFSQMYPKGHGYLGYMDGVGRQNVIHHQQSVIFKTPCETSLELSGHFFWRASREDGLYTPGSSFRRPAGAGLARHIGDEFNILFKWKMDCHLKCMAGYSHFWPGSYMHQIDSSRSDDSDHYYLAFDYVI